MNRAHKDGPSVDVVTETAGRMQMLFDAAVVHDSKFEVDILACHGTLDCGVEQAACPLG